MKNEQILKKAVDRALDNGAFLFGSYVEQSDGKKFWTSTYFANEDEMLMDIKLEEIIFSHDFAKAFWGEEKIYCIASYGCHPTHNYDDEDSGDPYYDGNNDTDKSIPTRIPAWQYHLQQMVLEEDKVKYLKKFL